MFHSSCVSPSDQWAFLFLHSALPQPYKLLAGWCVYSTELIVNKQEEVCHKLQ